MADNEKLTRDCNAKARQLEVQRKNHKENVAELTQQKNYNQNKFLSKLETGAMAYEDLRSSSVNRYQLFLERGRKIYDMED